jgi:hypothetical protein
MQSGGTNTTEPQKPGSKWTPLQRLLDSALLLVAFMLIYASLRGAPLLYVAILFAGVAVSMVAASVFLHEIGHAFAAWFARWRVIVIAVWPIALHLPSRSLVISRKTSTSDGGGYVVTVPGSLRSATRFNRILVSLGGPLASLAIALVCFAIAATPRDDPRIVYDMGAVAWAMTNHDPFETRIANLIGGFGAFNFRSFAWTIIPMTYWTGDNSDGRNILNALIGKGDTDGSRSRWIATMLHYNVRLRDIPAWMYHDARTGAARFQEDISFHDGLDIARALDAEAVDPEQVRARIETYRAIHGDNDWLLSCEAWLAVVYEDNVEVAEKALILRTAVDTDYSAMHAAAEAVVAARQGQPENVVKSLARMDQELRTVSAFPNATFDDIRLKIELIAAQTPRAVA